MYTAIVLDDDSKKRLINSFSKYIPKKYKIYADHMTINMGKLKDGPLEGSDYLGKTARIIVNSIAWDDKVIAVGVRTKIPSTNDKKHITLAVNINNGGKPYFSNKLENWISIPSEIKLFGTIQEVK